MGREKSKITGNTAPDSRTGNIASEELTGNTSRAPKTRSTDSEIEKSDRMEKSIQSNSKYGELDELVSHPSSSSGDAPCDSPAIKAFNEMRSRMLSAHDQKAQRLKDESEMHLLSWSFKLPTKDHILQLQTQFGAFAGATLISMLFHQNMEEHLKGILELLKICESEPVEVISFSDLILKWCTLRLFNNSTRVLTKTLDLVLVMLNLGHKFDIPLCDVEVSNFIPYLIMKSGSPKIEIRDKVRHLIKELMLGILQFFMNRGMLSRLTTMTPNPIRLIAECLSDTISTVRREAMTSVIVAYSKIGERIWSNMGTMGAKDLETIKQTLKRSRVIAGYTSEFRFRKIAREKSPDNLGEEGPEKKETPEKKQKETRNSDWAKKRLHDTTLLGVDDFRINSVGTCILCCAAETSMNRFTPIPNHATAIRWIEMAYATLLAVDHLPNSRSDLWRFKMRLRYNVNEANSSVCSLHLKPTARDVQNIEIEWTHLQGLRTCFVCAEDRDVDSMVSFTAAQSVRREMISHWTSQYEIITPGATANEIQNRLMSSYYEKLCTKHVLNRWTTWFTDGNHMTEYSEPMVYDGDPENKNPSAKAIIKLDKLSNSNSLILPSSILSFQGQGGTQELPLLTISTRTPTCTTKFPNIVRPSQPRSSVIASGTPKGPGLQSKIRKYTIRSDASEATAIRARRSGSPPPQHINAAQSVKAPGSVRQDVVAKAVVRKFYHPQRLSWASVNTENTSSIPLRSTESRTPGTPMNSYPKTLSHTPTLTEIHTSMVKAIKGKAAHNRSLTTPFKRPQPTIVPFHGFHTSSSSNRSATKTISGSTTHEVQASSFDVRANKCVTAPIQRTRPNVPIGRNHGFHTPSGSAASIRGRSGSVSDRKNVEGSSEKVAEVAKTLT